MKLSNRSLAALKCAIDAKGQPQGAIPADVLTPLIKISEPDLRVSIDFSASDIVGAPVVTLERRLNNQKLVSLTKRQKEIARLLSDGLSNREISERLGISLATVKDHVHAILNKLDVSSRLALVAYLRS